MTVYDGGVLGQESQWWVPSFTHLSLAFLSNIRGLRVLGSQFILGNTTKWRRRSRSIPGILTNWEASVQPSMLRRCLELRGTGEAPDITWPRPVKPVRENRSNGFKVPKRLTWQLVLDPKERWILTGFHSAYFSTECMYVCTHMHMYLPGWALTEAAFNLERDSPLCSSFLMCRLMHTSISLNWPTFYC